MAPKQESGMSHMWVDDNALSAPPLPPHPPFRGSINEPSPSSQSSFWSFKLTGARAHALLCRLAPSVTR